jgi:hypothetical protein
MPDAIMVPKVTKFNRKQGLVTSVLYCSGTKQFPDPFEYLFNVVTHGPSENIPSELRSKAMDIESKGRKYRMSAKFAWYIYLDPEWTRVCKFVMLVKVFDIREVDNTTLSSAAL